VETIAVRLSGRDWLAAWKADVGRMRVRAARPPRLRERVAVRVQLADPSPVSATLLGTVASLHRHDGHHHVDVVPDAESLNAIGMLCAAARGEPVRFLERHLRYLVKLPVMVSCDGAETYATTVSLSQGGCALRWAGALPRIGTTMRLRMGAGPGAAELRGVVCWRSSGGSSPIAGVRFVVSGVPLAVRNLLAEAERAGAPKA